MSDLASRIETLLREGLSQREVARRLGCSKMTIHRHRIADLPTKAPKGRQGASGFPVHPDVEAVKLELLAAFVDKRDTGPLVIKLQKLLAQHHPRDQRHPDQLEQA